MSDWSWVALGYATVYGVVVVYAGLLVRRVSLARRANLDPQGSSGGAG